MGVGSACPVWKRGFHLSQLLFLHIHFMGEGFEIADFLRGKSLFFQPGFANWFSVQFKEEQDHAMIFIKYILSRGGKVTLKAIDNVQTEWATPLAAFEDTLAHEKKVTAMINNLYAMAEEEKDYATKSMLGWFIDEQVEEEETAQGYIDALKMIKDNGFGIYTLDKELGARTYTQAAPLAGK